MSDWQNHGEARWWPIWFAMFCCGIFAFAASRPEPYPRELHHHVQVLTKLGHDMWRMHDDELGTFIYQGCPDFPNESVIWAGYIADHAIWEEQGDCKSIRDTGLAFIWERDEQGNAKEIENVTNAIGPAGQADLH